MARRRGGDLLQNYAFWLIDVTPSRRAPFLALHGPAFGFSAISNPEVTVATTAIDQMNQPFAEHAISGASIGAVTLSRGVRFYDSSMWIWIDRFIRGEDVPQRTMVLIHNSTVAVPSGDVALPTPDLMEILRAPGKVYILWDVIPTRYSTGSGLDAKSGDISVAELEIQPHEMTELSLDPSTLEALGV